MQPLSSRLVTAPVMAIAQIAEYVNLKQLFRPRGQKNAGGQKGWGNLQVVRGDSLSLSNFFGYDAVSGVQVCALSFSRRAFQTKRGFLPSHIYYA